MIARAAKLGGVAAMLLVACGGSVIVGTDGGAAVGAGASSSGGAPEDASVGSSTSGPSDAAIEWPAPGNVFDLDATTPDPGADVGATCQAVTQAQAVISGPTTADWACASSGCCDQFTACVGDANCVALALCFSKCDAGNATTCLGLCAKSTDAGTTALGEAEAALTCLGNCQLNPTLDGGKAPATSDAGDAAAADATAD